MNKFFKLVIVNLLGLFDINKIVVAREDGVKSNLEKKTVVTGIIAVVYGYLLYKAFIAFHFQNSLYILSIGFLMSSLLCFFINLFIIEPVIFKNNDNEMLFSLPITRHQILFSKLFVVYLRNMLLVIVIMLAAFLSYGYFVKDISDTFIMMGVISTLFIPFVPIVLSTIVVYVNAYYKVKTNHSFSFRVGRFLILVLVVGMILYLFRDIKSDNINVLIESFIHRGHYLYFISWLFDHTMANTNIFWLLLLIGVSCLFIYLYTFIISNNYLQICSVLKGQKKRSTFIYKRSYNFRKLFGMVKKEVINLFNNKFYLFNSYGIMVIFSFLLIVFFHVYDVSKLYTLENVKFYMNLYVPTLLVLLVNLSGSAISSVSLEKQNIDILRTMPVSMEKVLCSKMLTNVLLGSIFVVINGSIVWYYLDLSNWSVLFSYVIPFISLVFISLIAVILDYRFIEKIETDDNAIIKQRFICLVPSFIAVLIGIGTLFIPVYKQYKWLLGSYVLAMVIGILCCIGYLMVAKKRLLENLNK